MTTPLSNFFDTPDTMLGIFDPGGTLRAFNDDGGDSNTSDSQFGSTIRLFAQRGGVYNIKTTGFGDPNFVGDHSEAGDYAVTWAVIPQSGGDFNDSPLNDDAAHADPLGIGVNQAAVARVSLGDPNGGDVDFFSVTLKAGQVLSAETAALDDPNFTTPDTMLAVFDTDGSTILVDNDDAGSHDPNNGQFSDFSSSLRFVAPADGTYFLAATGFGDDDFVGSHSESGEYGLTVSVVPEPSSMLLIAAGGLLSLRRRRNRVRRADRQDHQCRGLAEVRIPARLHRRA